jgi:cellulose 1,4-beta-cellobiosidase
MVAALVAAACGTERGNSDTLGTTSEAVIVCNQFATTSVGGGEYDVQTDEWNSTATQCLNVNNTSFTVATANFNLPNSGPPASYPSIYKGCHWGTCTSSSTSGMPVQVAALPQVSSSWATTQPAAGAYDVAYDIWFNQSSTTNGQPNGAELMIWLASTGGVSPAGSIVATVTLAGTTWNVWETPMSGWTYVAYQRVTPTTAVSGLDVRSFVQDAVARGFIQPSWYLIDIEAGFEIWAGGQGLATNSFSANVGGTTRCDRFATTSVSGGQYIVQNNEWNSTAQECVAVSGTSFFVTQGNFNLPTTGSPAAYPSIFTGCHWGTCTNSTTSGLPVQVKTLPSVRSSWATVPTASGTYATAYDIWLNQTPSTTGLPNGTELMIWLRSTGGVQPGGSLVGTATVAGATWNVWQANQYIAYQRTAPTSSVDNLDIGAVLQDAVARGAVQSSWYLIDIEAGFDIWRGGQGLATSSFSASVGPCAPSCVGQACGASDGCGGTCAAGTCDAGLHCSAGACVCDATSCGGCCMAGQCQMGTSSSACGTGGSTCAACSFGTTCNAGQCTQPPATAVLFGGFSPTAAALNDTWEWDGNAWVQRAVSGAAPSPRFYSSMAGLAGKTVLFGGGTNAANFGDTWEWDGTAWTLQNVQGPPAGSGGEAAALGGRAVFVMGMTGPGGTWDWDGSSWTQEAAAGPPPRYTGAAASLADSVVLFGGTDASGAALADTWVWHGGTWTQRAVSGPSARTEHAMATLGNKVILFGGQDGAGADFNDTWEWDGTEWTQRAVTGPSARYHHAMATLGNKVVLFGGTDDVVGYLGDTWEWDGTSWTRRDVAVAPSPRGYHVMASLAAQ